MVSILLLKLFSPTAKNLAGYMSLTYSITGLLVILGIAEKHVMAADVAIVQGAVLATFYVLSGDARHLILTDQVQASNVVFFRLIWIIPLAFLSYFMSSIAGQVEAVIAYGLILRRSTEWLAEVHVTEIERENRTWPGWYLQPFIFLLLIGQIAFSSQLWLIWIWAISPILFSMKFIRQAKPHNFFNFGLENITSTAVIGFTGYIVRVLIVSLTGKEFSGMLFPGYAIGSFVGTMVANVAGPTAIRKGLLHSYYFTIGLIVWSLVGGLIFSIAESVLYKTLGLSIIGGAVMIIAQHSRLYLLKDNHTLELDLLLHLLLVSLVPAIYYFGGMQWLSANYLFGALIAWIFYKGSSLAMEIDPLWRIRIFILIIILLIFPVFFQLNGHIYNIANIPMVDSGGNLRTVPLPISLFVCYLGVIFFGVEYHQSKPVILTIAAMFILLITSTILLNQGVAKLILLVQYMVPTVGLLLGIALHDFNQKLIAKTILYFLVIFVPIQLLASWFQGQLALSHYLYIFSVYQHYQYVPLVMVGLYAWTWVELRDTQYKLIYFLSPWMAVYVAAGNSILALFGLVGFACVFAYPARNRKLDILIPVIIIASIAGYFFLNSQISSEISRNNNRKGIRDYGIFVEKLFDSRGHWLYAKNTHGAPETPATPVTPVTPATPVTQLPVNIIDRGILASIYLNDIIDHPTSILIGHSSPPARTVATSAHNYYLDLTYNFGVLASLPLLLLISYTIFYSFKQRVNNHSLVWFLSIILFFLMIDNNLKVTLRQPYPGIVVFFMWGILLGKLNPRTRIID